MAENSWDVVVVGSGTSGGMTAIRLRQVDALADIILPKAGSHLAPARSAMSGTSPWPPFHRLRPKKTASSTARSRN